MTKTHRFAQLPIGIIAGLLLIPLQPVRAMDEASPLEPYFNRLSPWPVAQLDGGEIDEDGGFTGGDGEQGDAGEVTPLPEVTDTRQYCFAIVPRTDCPTRCRKFLLLSNQNTLELSCILKTDCNQGTPCP